MLPAAAGRSVAQLTRQAGQPAATEVTMDLVVGFSRHGLRCTCLLWSCGSSEPGLAAQLRVLGQRGPDGWAQAPSPLLPTRPGGLGLWKVEVEPWVGDDRHVGLGGQHGQLPSRHGASPAGDSPGLGGAQRCPARASLRRSLYE